MDPIAAGESKRPRTVGLNLIPLENLRKSFPNSPIVVQHARFRSRVPYDNFVHDEHEGVLVETVITSDFDASANPLLYHRCGPRRELFFAPRQVIAGIVTCGGLCPGLNSVIQSITHTLSELYGAHKILGFVGGWAGIYLRDPLELTVSNTSGIQNLGGTMLSSARGGFHAEKILSSLFKWGVGQLYVIGGDGTMRGALELCKVYSATPAAQKQPLAILGVPKTIDNDIAVIDRSFGFDTAVEETLRAVRAASVEAECCLNCVGVVRVMGRYSGFIATHVAMASGQVDVCLIPEVPVIVDGGDHCILAHLGRVVTQKGRAVMVIAEGAGEEILGKTNQVDCGGNRILPELSTWVKTQVLQQLQEKNGLKDACVKYIDPSYMVRSVSANAADSVYCVSLSQGVVHAAMAGFTQCCAGKVHDRNVLIPLERIVELSPRKVNVQGWTWEMVVDLTGQPFLKRE